MSLPKYDLLAVFDEENDQLLFYRVPHQSSSSKRGPLTELPAFTLRISEFRGKDVNEAERQLGAGIFLFFEYHSNRKIGLRNYEGEVAEAADDVIGQYEKTSQVALDPGKLFELAMAYYDRGLSKFEWSDIEKAETLLRRATSDGLSKAKDFLENHWDRMKASAKRKMKN